MIVRDYIKAIIGLLLLFSVAQAHTQDSWKQWDTKVLNALHTARELSYLNEEEKRVILLLNMARHDGPLFVRTFLSAYVKEHDVINNSYLRSLKKDLNNTRGLIPMQARKDLTLAALGHALKFGRSGKVGHQGFNKRFDPLMGNPYMRVGENCSYGYEGAEDIVISLLIDEGIKDHGHRKNMLAPDFNSIGVAIRPHKSYRVNCVMDFGHDPGR